MTACPQCSSRLEHVARSVADRVALRLALAAGILAVVAASCLLFGGAR